MFTGDASLQSVDVKLSSPVMSSKARTDAVKDDRTGAETEIWIKVSGSACCECVADVMAPALVDGR